MDRRAARPPAVSAGPGTLAIPFAEKAAHVTAVEPAEGMCSVMQEKMAEFGVKNITIVQKRWEDVDVARDLEPPYDVVIASFSLGMQDIRAAIDDPWRRFAWKCRQPGRLVLWWCACWYSLILRIMVLYCYRSRYRSHIILARFIRFVNVLQELLSFLERFDPNASRKKRWDMSSRFHDHRWY